MRTFKRVCVFCGSNAGANAVYAEAARGAGRMFAERGIGMVYGGGRVGLMGIAADACLEAGGEVIGVIPKKLEGLEVGHTGLTELHVVDGMHPRKAMMAKLSDAFVAMPGGFGTFEELFEMTTWTQLQDHDKPVGVLNVNGYYDHLVAFLRHAVAEGFIRGVHAELILADDDLGTLLERLAAAQLPTLDKWIKKR